MKGFFRYFCLHTLGFLGLAIALGGTFVLSPALQSVLLGNLSPSIKEGTLRTGEFKQWTHTHNTPYSLILGNSTTLYSIHPGYMESTTHPKSFSLASNGQTLVLSREILKWANRQQQPSHVLLDLNEEMCWNPGTESAFDHIQNNPCALDREFASLSAIFSNTHMALCSLCKGVAMAMGQASPSPQHILGHVPKYNPPTGPITCDSSLVTTLPENQEALMDIAKFCQARNIELTLIHHPRLNGIHSDLTLPTETRVIEGMNWEYSGVDTMFHDDHHLRSAVASIYSQWVAEQLQIE